MCKYVSYTNTSSQTLPVSEEHCLYVSSRMGMDQRRDTLFLAGAYNPTWCGTSSARRELGNKHYELSNHLGNVLLSITDKKAYKTLSGSLYFEAEITTISDYYPFGSAIQTRAYSAVGYRFGFNTQERETELGADLTSAEFWMYDGKLGRRWNVDPVPQVSVSDYAVNGNNPLLYMDIFGNEKESIHLDPKGRFICAYNDGDNSIYKHQTAYTKERVDHWRAFYGVKSGEGVKVGSYNPWYYELNKSKLQGPIDGPLPPAQTAMEEVKRLVGAVEVAKQPVGSVNGTLTDPTVLISGGGLLGDALIGVEKHFNGGIGTIGIAVQGYKALPSDIKRTYAYKLSKATGLKSGNLFHGAKSLTNSAGQFAKALGPYGTALGIGVIGYEVGYDLWDAHTIINGSLMVGAGVASFFGAPVVLTGIGVYGVADYFFGIGGRIDKTIGRNSGLWGP